MLQGIATQACVFCSVRSSGKFATVLPSLGLWRDVQSSCNSMTVTVVKPSSRC